MKRSSAAFLLALALGAVGCARNGQPGSAQQAPAPVTILRVDNESVLDMDIFVVSEAGARMRIGFVDNHSTAELRIPPGFLFNVSQLRFIADPVAGRSRSVSQEISVAPGDTALMTIPN